MAAETNTSIYRAKFRGIKVHIYGQHETLNITAEIYLRPVALEPHLYLICWGVFRGWPDKRPRELQNAKARAASQFIEQLTEWEEVKP